MEAVDQVKQQAEQCSRCSTCKYTFDQYLPSCPPGQMHQLESYWASGRMYLAKGVIEGDLDIDDEAVLERLYTCTFCRACEDQCRSLMQPNIMNVITAMRQRAVSEGALLLEHTEMIESLKKEDNTQGKPKAERGDWAAGLEVKDITSEKADVVYHAGCVISYEPDLRDVAKSTIALLKSAGVDVGIAGKNEACCGGRAYETGYLGEFTKYAQHNQETYKGCGASKLVTSCSDGYSYFKLLYPKENIDLGMETLHIVEYLDQLIKEGALKLTKDVPMKVTYHDPCHLGRFMNNGIFDTPTGVYDPPRDILNGIPGLELIEMERNRNRAWCCGAGGGVQEAFPEQSLWTANERIKEAIATGAQALVTSCPWCERNFKDAIEEYGEKIEIYDIAQIAAKAL